jgi:hypothetical protein
MGETIQKENDIKIYLWGGVEYPLSFSEQLQYFF